METQVVYRVTENFGDCYILRITPVRGNLGMLHGKDSTFLVHGIEADATKLGHHNIDERLEARGWPKVADMNLDDDDQEVLDDFLSLGDWNHEREKEGFAYGY